MAETLRDDLRVLAVGQHTSGRRVEQVVKPGAGHLGLGHQPTQAQRQGVSVYGAALWRGEDKPKVVVSGPAMRIEFSLARPAFLEDIRLGSPGPRWGQFEVP